MALKQLVIVGGGGFGREVLNLIRQHNKIVPEFEPIGFIDNSLKDNFIHKYPVFMGTGDITSIDFSLSPYKGDLSQATIPDSQFVTVSQLELKSLSREDIASTLQKGLQNLGYFFPKVTTNEGTIHVRTNFEFRTHNTLTSGKDVKVAFHIDGQTSQPSQIAIKYGLVWTNKNGTEWQTTPSPELITFVEDVLVRQLLDDLNPLIKQ